MSGRALYVVGVTGGALMLLSGCTLGGGHSDGAAATPALASSAPPPIGSIEHPRPVECVDGSTYHPGQSPSPGKYGNSPPGRTIVTSTSATPGSSPPSAPASTPSSHRATPTHSAGSPSPSAGAKAKADVTVGPLTWQALGTLSGGDQSGRGIQNSGGWHYRITSVVDRNAVVTVTVGAQQRARAGLEFGGEYGVAPAPAITFHGCPGGPTSFLGAFFVAGDGRACVPLDIRVGDAATRHVVISFFNGRCPA